MFNNADEFFETMGEGGNAYRLKDINGIGPKTADKINSLREVNTAKDIKDMSADELSDKAGISYNRASTAISGVGGNPNVSKRSNTGSVSAAGIKTKQGDFMVGFGDLDRARARNDPRSRSEEAVRVDERKRAPVTTDYEKWKDNPGRWDYPGVDTPTQDPKLLPKDLKAGNPNTAEFQGEETRPTGPEEPAGLFIDGPEGESIKERQQAQSFLAAAGVPASSEEVFKGTNAGSITNSFMGPTYRAGVGPVESDRPDEEQAPPQAALQAQSRGEVAAIPEPGEDRFEINLPDKTLSVLRTGLNERTDDYFDAFEPNNQDTLMGIKERISIGESIELSRGEYMTAKRILQDEKERKEEVAGKMEQNIFGDTEEQAEWANEAYRGLINNPPR